MVVSSTKADGASKSIEATRRELRDWWPVSGFPLWRGLGDLWRDEDGHRMFAVEEYSEDGELVVRAELPGIDPETDVTIMLEDDTLFITSERREQEEHHGRHFHRKEMRYGSFARAVTVPHGTDETKVSASYRDGILEVRVPLSEGTARATPRRIPVTRP